VAFNHNDVVFAAVKTGLRARFRYNFWLIFGGNPQAAKQFCAGNDFPLANPEHHERSWRVL